MSSVWDDPETLEEEITPLPETPAQSAPIGIPPEKLEALTVQVIERVVREIVPEIAERLIREELDRLVNEPEGQ
jgi:hypothetical protein